MIIQMLGFRGSDYVKMNQLAVEVISGLVSSFIRLNGGESEVITRNINICTEQGLILNLVDLLNQAEGTVKSILPILKTLCENSADATLAFLNLGACGIV